MKTLPLRQPETADIDALAQIWFSGWQDAHLGILPPELARHRTLESFHARLAPMLSDTRVSGPVGAPLGFAAINGDELYQLYVSRDARGTGLAAKLTQDAETRIAAQGHKTAWLACGIGNEQASRFYEKAGWVRVGVETIELNVPEVSGGIFPLDIWRFEKQL